MNQQIEELFSNDESTENLAEQVHQLILQIEPKVRETVSSSLSNNNQMESMVQNLSAVIESSFMEQIIKRMEKKAVSDMKNSLPTLSQNMEFLREGVHQLSRDVRRIGISPSSTNLQIKNSITSAVYDKLKSQYSRSELKVLHDSSFTQPEEDSYEFLSPEGEFLEKNRAVYEKLRKANPYHEQGILARSCGLRYIQEADAFYADGNKESAQEIHQKAQTMIDITEGSLPFDVKDIYEECTGKDLFTGKSVSLQAIDL